MSSSAGSSALPGAGAPAALPPDLGKWQTRAAILAPLPETAIPTGSENGHAFYTCRGKVGGRTFGGKAFPANTCNTAADGATRTFESYEILVGDGYAWQPVAGPLTSVPVSAIAFGAAGDGSPSYACRVSQNNAVQPGQMTHGRCAIEFGGAEKDFDNFELLVQHDYSAEAVPSANGEVVWPNAVSLSNSDPWLTRHHEQITQLKPRALVLNFANGRSTNEVSIRWNELSAALAEASRYHGYKDPSAKPFVQHQLVKQVDLIDNPIPAGWTAPNSSLMPRLDGGIDFAKLYSADFANRMAIADPAAPSKKLGLCDMLKKGVINEIFIALNKTGTDSNVPEVIEYKQQYDIHDRTIPGLFNPSVGIGGFSPADLPEARACGVSVRVSFIEMTGTLSGALHVFVNNMERWGGAVHSYDKFFREFFNTDFVDRFHTPFDSWYDLNRGSTGTGDAVTYPNSTTAQWSCAPGTPCAGQSGTIAMFDQGCGNAQFPPNARHPYDVKSSNVVMSRCEHFGLHDGPGEKDIQTPYSFQTIQPYYPKYGDDLLAGPWQVYLMQSVPGFKNKATARDGTPIRNFWPYLYY